MALILVFHNVSDLAPTSDYDVVVRVNDRLIATGYVEGHRRSDGWKELVRHFLERGECHELPNAPRSALAQTLSAVNTVPCSARSWHQRYTPALEAHSRGEGRGKRS